MTTRQVPVVTNNASLAAGAPGRVICGIEKELFTGVVQNTGTVSSNFTLELPGGVSDPVTVPPGGFIKFRNISLLSVRVSTAVTISILGVITLYDTVDEWLRALALQLIDIGGIFAVTVQAFARPFYHDRNPLTTSTGNRIVGTAPHALTTRNTYTVPANRKAFIDNAYAAVMRRTAATTALLARTIVLARGFTIMEARIFTNGVGDKELVNSGTAGLLLAAEQLLTQDEDLSTAGTADFNVSAGITEFDA